jgi:hypothetical protein
LLKNVKVELNEDDEFGDAFIDDDDNYGSFSDSYDEFPDPPNNVKLISNHETTFTTAEGTNFDETDFTISVGRGEVKIFFCEQCSEQFPMEKDVCQHIKDTKHQSRILAKCFNCQKVLCSNLIRSHLWNEHWNLKPSNTKENFDFTPAY